MVISKNVVISIFAVLMLVAVTASVGIYVGMKYGAEQWVFLTAPAEGVQRVRLLRMLREGKVDEAVRLVESQLDYYILFHWDFLRTGRRQFLSSLNENTQFMKNNMAQQMAIIAEYKTHFPSDIKISPHEQAAPEIKGYLRQLEERYSGDLEQAVKYYRNLQEGMRANEEETIKDTRKHR